LSQRKNIIITHIFTLQIIFSIYTIIKIVIPRARYSMNSSAYRDPEPAEIAKKITNRPLKINSSAGIFKYMGTLSIHHKKSILFYIFFRQVTGVRLYEWQHEP